MINLFNVQIKLYENFLNENETENLLLIIKKEDHNNHRALVGESISSYHLNTDILKNIDIKKRLHDAIYEYSNILGIGEQIIDISWTNIQNEKSILKRHSHGIAPISGALYLKTDELSSNIYFYNPNPYISMMNLKNNQNNYEYTFFKPKIGDLFLFPGWLQHGSDYETNNSKERIVLSFNTKLKK